MCTPVCMEMNESESDFFRYQFFFQYQFQYLLFQFFLYQIRYFFKIKSNILYSVFYNKFETKFLIPNSILFIAIFSIPNPKLFWNRIRNHQIKAKVLRPKLNPSCRLKLLSNLISDSFLFCWCCCNTFTCTLINEYIGWC